MTLRETTQPCNICIKTDEKAPLNSCEGCSGSGLQIVTEKSHENYEDSGPFISWIEIERRPKDNP